MWLPVSLGVHLKMGFPPCDMYNSIPLKTKLIWCYDSTWLHVSSVNNSLWRIVTSTFYGHTRTFTCNGRVYVYTVHHTCLSKQRCIYITNLQHKKPSKLHGHAPVPRAKCRPIGTYMAPQHHKTMQVRSCLSQAVGIHQCCHIYCECCVLHPF